MNHEAWLEQAEIYALGALDDDERRQIEAHLAEGCRVCAERIRETSEAVTILARALHQEAPPAALRTRLMEAIDADEDAFETEGGAEDGPPIRRAPRWAWWAGWATALAAAALLLVVGFSLSKTQEELERLRGRVAILQEELTEREATLRFLSDPNVRYVSLAGLPASPGASGWLLWNPEIRQGLFLARGLPAAPPDRTYELWGIAGAEPVPAGVFKVDSAGRALFRLPPLLETKPFDTFAVTLEPAGGTLKPSGPMHLAGKV
jgi:anti-sigma-K factor RskA